MTTSATAPPPYSPRSACSTDGDRPLHAAPPPQRIYPFPQCRRASGPGWQADPRRPRQLCHTQTSQSAGLAVAPSALDLPLHPDLCLNQCTSSVPAERKASSNPGELSFALAVVTRSPVAPRTTL